MVSVVLSTEGLWTIPIHVKSYKRFRFKFSLITYFKDVSYCVVSYFVGHILVLVN